MKKAVWGAFLLMTTLAAAGLCETDYTLSNPHIRYEKIEGARQEEAAQADGAGISLSDMAAAEDAQSGAPGGGTGAAGGGSASMPTGSKRGTRGICSRG